MEKKKFSLKSPKIVKIPFGDEEIEVIPYLDVESQIVMTKSYIDNYRGSSAFGTEKDVLMAEHSLKLAVLDLCTNINVAEISINDVMANYDLYVQIISAIKNYSDFRRNLSEILLDVSREEDREVSIGRVIEAIYNKAQDFAENLTSLEMSDENVAKISGLLKEVQESPILKSLASNLAMGVPKTDAPSKNKKPKKKSEIIQ